MAAGWTIGRFFNIPIRVHYSMLLLLLTYDWIPGHGIAGTLAWLAFIVLTFGSILLHEVGHALAARRYGIQTQDIVLTPIGGIARLLSMPRTPRQEIVIAVAGPAVSLGLAAILYAVSQLLWIAGVPQVFVMTIYPLFWVNRMLGLFNLIPALPMDGGRVLRGFLALKRDHLTATRIAAKVSRTIAVTGGAISVIGSWLGYFPFQWSVVLIAIFVYITAGVELKMAELRAFQKQVGATHGPFHRSPGPFTRTSSRHVTYAYTRASTQEDAEASDEPSGDPAESEWSYRDPNHTGDPVVITEGKAEVISRRDPEE
ncbi:MAG: site-2 protease family protein [Myxococcota bacterium]|nr:site-2 protease family protein [Myxococcota bacterium]